jgi:hypothetical protein
VSPPVTYPCPTDGLPATYQRWKHEFHGILAKGSRKNGKIHGLQRDKAGATNIWPCDLPRQSHSSTTTAGYVNLEEHGDQLDLPREIRKEIYAHLWTSNPSFILLYSTAPYLEPGCDIAPAAVQSFSTIKMLCLPHSGIDAASANDGIESNTTGWHLRIKARGDIGLNR